MPPTAELLAIDAGAKSLRGIIQREHILTRANRFNGGPIRGQAEQINANHGARAQPAAALYFLNASLKISNVHIVAVFIHIHENRRGPQHQRHLGGRGIGEGGQEYRITAANPLRHHGDLQRIRAGGNAHAMRRPREAGEPRFKLRHFGAHNETARIEHCGDAPIKLRADQFLLRQHVKQLNGARFAHQARDLSKNQGRN